MYLPDFCSMRFTTLSNYYLNDWWCDVSFCLFTWWFDPSFFVQQFETGNRWIRTRTRIDYRLCIASKPTNQVCLKPYQEIYFKSHLNSVLLWNKEKYCQICLYMSCVILLFVTCLCSLLQWNWTVPIIKVIEML